MSTALATRPSTELAGVINREHAQVISSATNMVEFAINCGEALIEAKATVAHGEWAKWLEGNFDGSHWVARKYMQLAREERANRGSVTKMDSVRTALRAIANPRTAPELPPPALDPETPAAKLLAAAKGFEAGEPSYIDSDAVEIAPSGIEERRWNATLHRYEEVRSRMNEAVNPGLTPEAAASALHEASTAARQTAIELEQMATVARRRAA